VKNFRTLDDVQLWRITDVIDDQEYSYPVFATPGTFSGVSSYLVRPAIPLPSTTHYRFLHGRLGPLAMEHAGSEWYINAPSFKRIASKCEGITPNYYLRWGTALVPEVKDADQQEVKELSSDPDFVKAMAAYPEFPSQRSALICFLRFCNLLQQRLLQHHMPVNLGCVVLRAFPYRRNWLPILHRAHAQNLNEGDFSSVVESLFNVDLVGMDGDKFTWTIEATPTPEFRKTCQKMEAEAASFGPTLYLQRWAKLCAKLKNEAVNTVQAWVEDSRAPLGAVDTSLPEKLWSLASRRSRGRVRNAPPPPPETYYSTDPGRESPIVSSASLGETPDPEMQEVPDAELAVELVRPHRKVGGAGSEPRVLVPAGPDSHPPDQALLAG